MPTPTRRPSAWAVSCSCSASSPRDDNVHIVGSPLYHTAVLRFSGAAIHMGHTVVLMDKWTRRGHARADRALPGDALAHGPHPVPPPPRPPRRRRGTRYDLSSLRHMIHAAAPCPVDTKHAMIEWWGPVIDEYYAASEGGGTIVNTEEWLDQAGHRRQAVAHLGDRHLRRRRQPPGGQPDRHRLHGHAGRPTSSTTRTRRRPRRTGSASSSPSATSATSTTTASSSCATARST